MSRVGSQPIPVPNGVDVAISGNEVTVKGPKGKLQQRFDPDMILSEENGVVQVGRPSDQRQHRALHGLTRTLVANMIQGVNEGYVKTLELVGIGYRAHQSGKNVSLNVMLSHTVEMEAPPGIELTVEGANIVRVSGADKQAVGQVAAMMRSVRPPNAYTGKGIRYQGQQIKLEAGRLRAIGRSTQGVRLMDLDEGDKIANGCVVTDQTQQLKDRK